MPKSRQFNSREERYKNIKKHRGLKIVLLVLVLLICGGGAYALRISNQLHTAADKMYHSSGTTAKTIKNKKAFSILLLGVDTGADGRIDQGNSDTMIVATVNPKKKKVTLVSIPRDTLAQLQGTSSFNMQKINAAYNVGGSKMAMSTVEKMFDVPIDYYLTINMGALSKIVNTIGGVDVDVPFSFTSGGSTFKKGKMHLNGKQALAYARMRYEDPRGDYGRQKRQRQVISSMIESAVSLKTLTNFESILKALDGSIATNLSFSDMVSIQSNYRAAAKNVKSDYLQGQDATIDSLSYQVPTNTEIQRISDALRTQLGLKTTTVSNSETKQNDLNTSFDGTTNQFYTIYTESQLEGATTTADMTDATTDTTTSSDTTANSYSDSQTTGTAQSTWGNTNNNGPTTNNGY